MALYSASAGVGQLTLIDDDTVDLTNLQRQIMHTTARVGQPKVDSARQAIEAINPGVQVHTVARRADAALLDALVPAADVVLDCGDNYATRHALNAACVRHRKPLVSGAAIGFDGQVSVYDPRRADSSATPACFRPRRRCPRWPAPLRAHGAAGAGGQPAGRRAIKLLCGIGQPGWKGRLLMIDSRQAEFTTVRLRRQSDCPVCQAAARRRLKPGRRRQLMQDGTHCRRSGRPAGARLSGATA